MNKNIIVLNGAARKNGSTAKLVEAFAEGTESAGNHVKILTGTLKTAADRLYAELECLGYSRFPKKSVLLMTADGGDYSQAVTWYQTYERNLRWKNLGEVLGKGKTKEAYQLGASI